MKNGNIVLCDACNEPLDGVLGIAKIKKRYLSIKGPVNWKYYDKHGDWHIVYAQSEKYSAIYELNFCNGFCLDDYMGQRLIMKAKYHEENNLPKIDITDI